MILRAGGKLPLKNPSQERYHFESNSLVFDGGGGTGGNDLGRAAQLTNF